jgi:hypothetical protein
VPGFINQCTQRHRAVTAHLRVSTLFFFFPLFVDFNAALAFELDSMEIWELGFLNLGSGEICA